MGSRVLALLALLVVAALVESALLVERSSRGLRGAEEGKLVSIGGKVPPLSVPDRETPIHLLISAFQDGPRCANTIFRALVQAEHRGRVSLNVLQAVGPGDVNCLEEFRRRYLPELCADEGCARAALSRVRFWTIPLEEGKGPVHQRGLLSDRADLTGDGSMCLSIDSHMDFLEGWDSALLQDWAATENEFAVLTAYPQATSSADTAGKQTWVSLCGYFLDGGIPRGAQAIYEENGQERGRPVLTMNWAAGQSFSRCHAERTVPVDKHLAWMFDGEEIGRAVRLWTHGYDLYNPRVSVVLHNYSGASQKFWSYGSPSKAADERASHFRLQSLLQGRDVAEGFGRYGLGDQRSIEEYVTWSRTDLGGKWRAFLLERGVMPNFDGKTATDEPQPDSMPGFCKHLDRIPVRNAKELVAGIGFGA